MTVLRVILLRPGESDAELRLLEAEGKLAIGGDEPGVKLVKTSKTPDQHREVQEVQK